MVHFLKSNVLQLLKVDSASLRDVTLKNLLDDAKPNAPVQVSVHLLFPVEPNRNWGIYGARVRSIPLQTISTVIPEIFKWVGLCSYWRQMFLATIKFCPLNLLFFGYVYPTRSTI